MLSYKPSYHDFSRHSSVLKVLKRIENLWRKRKPVATLIDSHPFFVKSLKIFKHYKLKPSFSRIKDNKAKDKVGVGDKPPSFNNLIKFDPI